ncbi:hypothetical protein niasHS_016111 [Heterodera schachtii]|uniref:D-lactate dehydratase n=2 Tax=Heterodera TaxID=34509 RepID=A0ABD2HS34_HETSC
MATKTALIIASDGSEDIELVTTSDVLRRAGVDVTIAGIQDKPEIELTCKTHLHVDQLFKDVLDKKYDAVVMPGGSPGSNKLAEDPRVGDVLRKHQEANAVVGAICGSPLALVAHDVARGATLTSHPSIKDKIAGDGYSYTDDNVCVFNNVVTSRGPGTAFEFALKLVEMLVSEEKAKEISNSLLVH